MHQVPVTLANMYFSSLSWTFLRLYMKQGANQRMLARRLTYTPSRRNDSHRQPCFHDYFVAFFTLCVVHQPPGMKKLRVKSSQGMQLGQAEVDTSGTKISAISPHFGAYPNHGQYCIQVRVDCICFRLVNSFL